MGADASVELVVGADGTIGGPLFRAIAAAGRPVVGTTRRKDSQEFEHLDLANPSASWNGPPVAVAYLCAAMTNLDACDRDPVGSARINVEATLRLAESLLRQGSFVVFFSTNHVFDGSRPLRKPEEPTCPFNEYGRQKAAGEQQLLALENTAVLRLTKVIGPTVPLFDRWIAAVRAGQTIRPFADLSLAPVKLARVLKAAQAIGSGRCPGIHHLSGDEDLSYDDAARIGLGVLGMDLSLLSPGYWRESGSAQIAPPRFSSLDVTRTIALLNEPIESSSQTVRDYFETQSAQ